MNGGPERWHGGCRHRKAFGMWVGIWWKEQINHNYYAKTPYS